MSNRGLFGLPQGQRSGVGASQGSDNPLWQIDPKSCSSLSFSITSHANGSWVQLSPGLPNDVVIYNTAYDSYITGTYWNDIGLGPAGSEVTVHSEYAEFSSASGNATVGASRVGSIGRPLSSSVYVPANTRISFRQRSGATGWSYGRIDYGVLLPSVKRKINTGMYVVGLPTLVSSNTWVTVSNAPELVVPFLNGCWVVEVAMNGPGSIDLQFATGSAGSETVASSSFFNTSGAGQPSSRYIQNGIPPFYWPPGTRLAIRARNSLPVGGHILVLENLR